MPFGYARFSWRSSGRLKKQIAELNAVTQPKGKSKTAAGYTAVKRSYGYDKTGNLIHSSDQRSGVTKFEYDQLGRITKADKETFAFDPAHNILSDGLRPLQLMLIAGLIYLVFKVEVSEIE
ncbi:RHS repeat domain-containing protein [Neisseria zalophi]|uniref:Teneurin-like YD-shell domain-containing protein n=1 Tax=Neisseria zalophi TaxID=640030 RepID=A0A5J6PU09_9NEIS|nr:RHS repeat domain-containing protein [Neisseria zalophi]QEY26181.1 hypothetical protein D0T92_06345 [Neisseria zalophi]